MTRDYGSPTAFFDLLFNILCCFVVLFSISFLLMSRRIDEDRKIRATAEFMITSTWPESSDDDVDTYVEDPMGNIVFFNRREEGLMHLDRDDLGKRSDTLRTADGKVYTVKENTEIVTIRGLIPGEYVVNVHYYATETGLPVRSTVKVSKVNPALEIVYYGETLLEKKGDEKTAVRFVIDKSGRVEQISHIFKSIVIF